MAFSEYGHLPAPAVEEWIGGNGNDVYFCVDERDSKPGALVFNRTISLKDSWSKQTQKK